MKLGDLVFIVLSIFDALSVLAISFKLFRMPFLEYKKQIILTSIVIAIVSFLNRVIFDIPQYDLTIQLIIYVVALRCLIKMRTFESTLIIVTGLLVYLSIQYFIYFILMVTGLLDYAAASGIEGFETYVLWISTILAVYLTAWLFFYMNLGFAFIVRPPHYFAIKSPILSGKNRVLALGLVGGIVFICINAILLFHMTYLWIYPFALVFFACLYRRSLLPLA
ncbi:hypothetical protein [Paenibacillus sp. P22]|uniref:hypothetical protein n=1 Tax=Paenibacillus sp. P22 TaxID=483908 RepID=UPI0004348F9E|nr:hypothetical protein [Paenibacillus sp. P22]CDN44174.1 Putative uncharacterized protein [Paenibacillus sp. P22]